jgi:nucleoid-associated protein YgaU
MQCRLSRRRALSAQRPRRGREALASLPRLARWQGNRARGSGHAVVSIGLTRRPAAAAREAVSLARDVPLAAFVVEWDHVAIRQLA